MREAFRAVEVGAETLLGVRILAGLGSEERAGIARRCSGGRFPARATVIAVADRSRDVYFVVSGRVRATIFSLGGRQVTFRDIGPGEAFGDLSAIDGEPRSADVVTLEDSVLVWLSARSFWEVLEEHPGVAGAVLRELAGLVRTLSERVVEFSTLGARNRLHAELLRLARASAGEDADRAVVAPPPTHAEIASRISSHREAVSREMQRLAEAGLVERQRGRLLFHDLRRLEDMVRQVKGA